jgi:hypothetical protein
MGKGLGKKERGHEEEAEVRQRKRDRNYIDRRGRGKRRWREVGNLKLRILSGRKLFHNGNVPSMKRPVGRLSGKIS